jgi:hypothetical protein
VIKNIISGGQTGANRAALDFALDHDMPHGGWCPKEHDHNAETLNVAGTRASGG